MAVLFDTFLFDTREFDQFPSGPLTGSFSIQNLTQHNWTAAITVGSAPQESDINSIPR
jgi:hypothetical protein